MIFMMREIFSNAEDQLRLARLRVMKVVLSVVVMVLLVMVVVVLMVAVVVAPGVAFSFGKH